MNTDYIRVINMTDPDEVISFVADGESRTFGRDDLVCDIVVWSALNTTGLSRVAGVLWKMEGQLWVRNLSTSHELEVRGPDGVTEPPLPVRLGRDDPGAARTLPLPRAEVIGPDGCHLIVVQPSVTASGRLDDPLTGLVTEGLPSVPPHLLEIALALCEPLLCGGRDPATYRHVGRRLGITSYKRIRVLVAQLCTLYAPHLVPSAPTAQADSGADSRTAKLIRGVWRFPADEPAVGPPSTTDAARPVPTAVPEYARVAELLVRRGLVRTEHLHLLPPTALEA